MLNTRLAAAADGLDRWLLAGVLVAAAFGTLVAGPARHAATNGGISIALAILVFTTGFLLDPASVRLTRPAMGRAALTVLASTLALPALAWLASRAVTEPALRRGVLAAGIAPAEVASVALAGLAGGLAALTALVLAGSVLITVLTAGPILDLLGAPATVSAATLLSQLALIVAAPLLAGMGLRALTGNRPRPEAAARVAGTLALLVLLWQVGGQVNATASYARVGLALLGYLAAAAVLGRVLAIRLPTAQRVALSLPVGMRDFAIAAGIATTAYGPRAAAPLAAYGVLVLLYGAGYAHFATRTPHNRAARSSRSAQ
ncbi:MAG: hypothetical protein ACRDRN_26205 [Sciscionella sp.]